jgi:inhibitor of KinA sporulation pathway (predicted exonuclease)
MARKLDQILVVDVESTCWERVPPKGQEAEIIEIGICPVDVQSLERLEKRSILVRPERSRVSQFCTELTTLSQKQLDNEGISFAEACRILRKDYDSRDRTWASFGDYDRRQFERQCLSWDVTYPFGPGHINIKTLFALTHNLKREAGMAKALRMMKHPLEGTHHRAVDDAWNIAAILIDFMLARREPAFAGEE